MSFRHYFWNKGEPWNGIRSSLAPQTLRAAHAALMCTARVSTSGIGQGSAYLRRENSGVGAIFPVWHDVMLFPMYLFQNKGIGVIVSQSRSGQVAAALWRLHGWPTTWGSTKKQQGVPALRKGISILKSGQSLGFTPDGPLGPRHHAQPGIVFLAAMTGAPIFPLGVALSRAWRLPTWDKHAIAQPFCHLHFHVGAPIHVPRDAAKKETELWRARIEEEIQNAMQAAREKIVKEA
jgi:lysophospholipid acyltransferase (LPLAT)-like uncharacterized protein